MTKEKTIKEVVKPKFKMELDINGTTIKGNGETFGMALDSIKPPFIKSRGVITVNFDKKTAKSHFMSVVEMRRLFNGSKMTKLVLENRLLKLLK